MIVCEAALYRRSVRVRSEREKQTFHVNHATHPQIPLLLILIAKLNRLGLCTSALLLRRSAAMVCFCGFVFGSNESSRRLKIIRNIVRNVVRKGCTKRYGNWHGMLTICIRTMVRTVSTPCQVTIRHGDRSAIHDLPGADEQKWHCLPFSDEVQDKWRGISR